MTFETRFKINLVMKSELGTYVENNAITIIASQSDLLILFYHVNLKPPEEKRIDSENSVIGEHTPNLHVHNIVHTHVFVSELSFRSRKYIRAVATALSDTVFFRHQSVVKKLE